ncbi:speckle-type POZ protein B-like isoform X1 [Daphnia magna]|uniref:speckle-type POZ protein B-like isoform X1 n=2 Tax=Daphnia magna TaxID=35525 RepID=UPI001E1BD557|nr:speckle-type POZ protein B-like isoform X1 [Daphnia magna]XP_045027674.1 speckle-type POZ protein B-like isoform X1 [Daphnia magna]
MKLEITRELLTSLISSDLALISGNWKSITMDIKVLPTSVHFWLFKTQVFWSSPHLFITLKKGGVHRISSSQAKMNQIVKKTGTFQLGASFTHSLADNWCQTVSEISQTDFEWNVQLPYKEYSMPSMTSSTVSSGAYCTWTLSLGDDESNIKIFLSIQPGLDHSKIVHHLRVSAGIADKKGNLSFAKTTLIDRNTGSSFGNENDILKINKEELWKSDCYEKDGNFTIYCAVAVWALKETKSGSLSKITSNISDNEFVQTQLKQLLENQTAQGDVILNVGDRIFRVHKNILSAKSQVFADTFYQRTREKLSNPIDIQDVDPDVFQAVLVYIYSGRISPGTMEKKAVGVFVVADKYSIYHLKTRCIAHLMKRMSAVNCAELLAIGDQSHPAARLKKYAVNFLQHFLFL